MADTSIRNYEVIQEGGVPIKAWIRGVELENKARQQLINLSKLPFIHKHVSVLPDVHWGMGSTIGSVIPTYNAIIPAAVGVDVGCLDKDTEYLTKLGWKKFNSYNGEDEVLQYDPILDKASFVKPIAYIKRPVNKMYHLHHSQGLDQMLCDSHKMLFYKGFTKERGSREYNIQISESFVQHHKILTKGQSGGFLTVFSLDKTTSNNSLTDEQLRVQIMVAADGCIRATGLCEVHIKKERKISRVKKLLSAANITWKKYNHKDTTVTFSFIPPKWTKQLDFLFSCNAQQLAIVEDEVFNWDGHFCEDGQRIFSTKDKVNADAIQYVLASCGIRAGIHRVVYKKENWCDNYKVYTTKNVYVNMAPDAAHPVKEVAPPDGFAYCFTVPTGFLVVRRNDNIFITGNCGVTAVRLNITAADLPDNLSKIRSEIERMVPHGRTNNGQSSDRGAWHDIPNNIEVCWNTLDLSYGEIINKHPKIAKSNSINHLGTLGTGNHFIELCLDEHTDVWLMLHSGSRGVGNRIGSYFIELAKEDMRKWFINIPDKNLAYLPEGTDNFNDYVQAVNWAQKFAKLNRKIMLYNSITAISNALEISVDVTGIDLIIDCHHNYVTKENHFGKNVWLTRKGAVRAREGDLGIIPGSMGTKSFIVRGKGNKDSFNSCSHGAGRRMSRTEAKKRYTIADHIKATEGVECRKDEAVLDETPAAYKDVDAVMKAQEDLVEIVHTLKQIVCVKG